MDAIFTRDLLGNSDMDSQELDLDVQVPSGWEKRLDLKSGKVYLQRCSSSNSSDNHRSRRHHHSGSRPNHLQDLNLPPPSSSSYPSHTHHDFVRQSDSHFLDLQLTSSSTSSSSAATSWNYRSVCTLDKVKSALERAERDQSRKNRGGGMFQSVPGGGMFRNVPGDGMFRKSASPCSSSSVSSSSEEEDKQVAAGCPSCLLYVLISRRNPRCPRCSSVVPLPGSNKLKSKKKYQFDLNM